MSLYPRPIQPYDPIVADQQPKPPVRYLRDNFQGTGQDSHTQPPAQDPAMWQALTNVQPITKGVIERRWGYTNLASSLGTGNRLFSFQRDSDGLRALLSTGQGNVQAFNEQGVVYNPSVFTPIGSVVRAVNSRNYEYFYDGIANDLQKWNGNATGGVSNWGIDATSVTANGGGAGTSFGPNFPITVTQSGLGTAWSNPANIEVDDGNSATVTVGQSHFVPPHFFYWTATPSQTLAATNFNFTASGTIVGIAVQIKCSQSPIQNNTATLVAQLLKNNIPIGSFKGAFPPVNSLGYITVGGTSDLWGTTWAPGDVNSANFGVAIYASGVGNVNIDVVKITVYVSQAGGGSYSGSGVSIVSTAGGAVTLTIGRTYYLTFYNSATGHFSDLTPASATTGALTSQQINLALATCSDPQVNFKYLLATADGNDPSILYEVAALQNGGAGDVTTYTDNTPDTTLVLNQVLLFTDQTGTDFGVALNTPPPAGTLAVKHQGRIWMAGVPGSTHSVYFSKAISELTLPNGFIAGKYEEAWPRNNYFDISDSAESVSGLLSDGQTLYIGSQYHVRRITGNAPINFSLPEIVHPQVGVINQETWQLVFTQGTPAGAIWLTPDFRVIQSNFNTYTDIGARIQDVLNALQPTAPQVAHAAFVADGEYDLYILAVPFNNSTSCDLHLVYDMRSQQWFVWVPNLGSQSLLYNVTAQAFPQWLFISGINGNLNQYQQSATTDSGTPFTVTATTSWLGLGESHQRKILNEIDYDGDVGLTVSINGALVQTDFVNPQVLLTNLPSVLGPLGTRKFFTGANNIKARYYQFSFQSTTTNQIALGSYNIEAIPFNDL